MPRRRDRFPFLILASLLLAVTPAAANNVPSLAHAGAGESWVYQFQGGGDGYQAWASLFAGKDGVLYGTTSAGGGSGCGGLGCGTVFELTPSRTGYRESVIYSFRGANDGSSPRVGVVADKDGALYGTTVWGGGGACVYGCGIVFKLTPRRSMYAETVLYRFQGGTDGAQPASTLIVDASGGLYGTTSIGGTGCQSPSAGCGTVFKLTPTGSQYVESILYRFQGTPDGRYPEAGVIADRTGALYGTTLGGGNPNPVSGVGGIVFKLTPVGSNYTETVLYRFQSGSDGGDPSSGLFARDGALYGTTAAGGGACNCGTAFKLTPTRAANGSSYTESVLYGFKNGTDGAFPIGGLVAGKDGALYGVTTEGGSSLCQWGCGVVYKITQSDPQHIEKVVHQFVVTDGADPQAGLISDDRGALYGTTLQGGSWWCPGGCGTVFRFRP